MLDLTHSFDNNAIYWPTEKGFHLEEVFCGDTVNGYFYSAYKFCAPEHGGTHIDAPRHFLKKGLTVDEIPIDKLIGDAAVVSIDINKTKRDFDYAITVEDIQHFEDTYGVLTTEDIVLFHTGWDKYWGDKKRYLGDSQLGRVDNLHFPGLSKEASQYLVDKDVKGVGLDTASLDVGSSRDFWAHRILLGSNKYGLENLTRLNCLPARGAKIIVAPMKIKGGSGAPSRVYAIF